MAKPAIKFSEPPARTPERQALWTRIENLAAARKRVAAVAAAQQRLRERRWAASSAVDEAQAAIETAKTNAAAYLTAEALGLAGEPPLSIEAARQSLQKAQDELAAIDAARAAMEQQTTEAAGAVQLAEMCHRDAIAAVVKASPATIALVAEFEKAKERYADLQSALSLVGIERIPDERWRGAMRRYEFWDCQIDVSELTLSVRDKWHAALAALETDADAPLPGEEVGCKPSSSTS